MDGSRFDRIARQWATRRTALGGLLGGLLLPFLSDDEGDARKKRQHNDRHKGRGKSHRRDKHARHKDQHGGDLGAEKKKKHKKKCKGGTIKCGKVCVTASTDASNCGACGKACGSGQACVGGVCESPPSTGTCPTGQIRCGSGCVDPTSDEAHCGGCGVQCQGDLTCLDGICGCADVGDTKCGTLCVDIHDDDDHCGGCNQACPGDLTCLNSTCSCAGSGKTQCGTRCVDIQTDGLNCGQCGQTCGASQRCQSGQCLTTTCGANEILCNGACVPSIGDHPCCSQFECGAVGPSNHIYCDLSQHQCRCNNSNYGICQRTADRRGLCNECCEGGIEELNCKGETGCNGFNFCTCPAGQTQCPGSDYRCYQSNPNPDATWDDPTTCINASGTNCVDCTQGGTKPYVCCWARTCVDASGYGPNTGGTIGGFCGGCATCPDNKICCNNGPGKAPTCKNQANGGLCPGLTD